MKAQIIETKEKIEEISAEIETLNAIIKSAVFNEKPINVSELTTQKNDLLLEQKLGGDVSEKLADIELELQKMIDVEASYMKRKQEHDSFIDSVQVKIDAKKAQLMQFKESHKLLVKQHISSEVAKLTDKREKLFNELLNVSSEISGLHYSWIRFSGITTQPIDVSNNYRFLSGLHHGDVISISQIESKEVEARERVAKKLNNDGII